MRIILGVLAISILIITPALSKSKKDPLSITCGGTFIKDEDEYRLEPDSISKKQVWCDSTIGYDASEKFVSLVLKKCQINSLCHIKGTVEGHGVFHWVAITSVRK